jgi:hypothetical protein
LGGPYSITAKSGTDANNNPTLTFTATYTFNFLTSFTLSRAIEVPAI